MSDLRQRIYAIVSRIPPGRVSTYGRVAVLAGVPGAARQVGYAMSALHSSTAVPWHRVLNAQGEVSQRANGDTLSQHVLLEAEGVSFTQRGRVPLNRFLWPGD